jgi:hypothetical protein
MAREKKEQEKDQYPIVSLGLAHNDLKTSTITS